MSESTVDDIFDLEFDHDILIQLLGKLSLDNIPSDVSETLLSLENRTEDTTSNRNSNLETFSPYMSEGFLLKPASQPLPASQVMEKNSKDSSANDKMEKENFLSSIGLVSGQRKTVKDPDSKADKNLKLDYVSRPGYCDMQHHLPLDDTQNFGLATSDNYSVETRTQNEINLQDLFYNACDSTQCDEHRMPHSSDQSNDALISKLHELFSCHQGKVYDIQLNDFDDSTKCGKSLPFNIEDELFKDKKVQSCHVDSSSFVQTSDDLLYTDKSNDSNDKPVISPDSGYDTSSCSSAISPYSPPISSESSYTLDIFGDTSDDELDSIVAAIVDYENSLLNTADTSHSNCKIPTLKNAKDPEDHKERILNFLKEPIYDDDQPDLKSSENKDENSSSFELMPKNVVLSNPRLPLSHFSTSQKSPPKSKEWKLGYEIKYAVRNDLQHAFLSKVKHSERNKILKQIQEDERAMKRIKVIQLLDKKLKLKRTAVDDRELKRRRIQCKDSC